MSHIVTVLSIEEVAIKFKFSWLQSNEVKGPEYSELFFISHNKSILWPLSKYGLYILKMSELVANTSSANYSFGGTHYNLVHG